MTTVETGGKRVATAYGTFYINSVRDKKMFGVFESGKFPNEKLLELTRRFINEKSTVIDIGAHIGTFAIPIKAIAQSVIAFEPDPETLGLLSLNIKESGASLHLVKCGLGSQKTTGSMVIRNPSNAGANTLVSGGSIPISTLDDEVPHADFIKIDVEGMELEVLSGGTRLIEQSRPVVLFEVNLSQLRAHGSSPRALEQFFKSRSYQLYFPLEQKRPVLARVGIASLLTALIAPRAWFFRGESAPFDLVAVPKEHLLPLRSVGFLYALTEVIGNNIAVKCSRLTKVFYKAS